jgi:hypothetical protein
VLANLEKAEFNEMGEPVAASHDNAGYAGPGTAGRGSKRIPSQGPEPQLGLFASEAGLLFKEIADLNLDSMTPLDAMNKLHELKKKVGNGG